MSGSNLRTAENTYAPDNRRKGHAAELVTNGGFETGNFTGWTTIPAATGSLFGVDGNPHSGSFAAFFGAVTPPLHDEIQQILPTSPGEVYTLSYCLANPGNLQNDFRVVMDGVQASDILNSAAFPYTHFTYNFLAASSSTLLEFQGYDQPSFFFLDDVSVNASVPEPPSILLVGIVALALPLGMRLARLKCSIL